MSPGANTYKNRGSPETACFDVPATHLKDRDDVQDEAKRKQVGGPEFADEIHHAALDLWLCGTI